VRAVQSPQTPARPAWACTRGAGSTQALSWDAYGLLGSAGNGDGPSHWAAGSASVGEESGQQGHVLEELDLRMPMVGEPPPRPSPRQGACLRNPPWCQAVWRPRRGLAARDKLFLHACAWRVEAALSTDAEAACESSEFIHWLRFSQALHQIRLC